MSKLVLADRDLWDQAGKAERYDWSKQKGKPIRIRDTKTGKCFQGRVRIRAVRCGKPTCTKCPHQIYAYAQFRDGKKMRDKYLGIARL